MTPMTNKTVENKNILPIELYNLARHSINNEKKAKKKNQHEKYDNITNIPLIGAL